MTENEHILTTLGEEGAEVAQRASKALRFGLEEVQPDPHANPKGLTNAERVAEEVRDVIGTYLMAAERGLVPPLALDPFHLETMKLEKANRILRFMVIGRANGALG